MWGLERMGGRCTIFWGDDLQDGKTIKKIHHGLRRPPFSGNTQQQTNNQCGRGEGEVGDEARGGSSVWAVS